MDDIHIPVIGLDNPLRRLFGKPNKHNVRVGKGQVVADLGCGPGFFTLPIAGQVGRHGKVYAVDTDPASIRMVEKKAAQRGYANIEIHFSSASNLEFIPDSTVDFVLAEGVLCCMNPEEHAACVSEIMRVLKPTGKAYISVDKSPFTYVSQAEWQSVLQHFSVEDSSGETFSRRWALVSKKEAGTAGGNTP